MLNLLSLPQGIETALWQTLTVSYFARHDARRDRLARARAASPREDDQAHR